MSSVRSFPFPVLFVPVLFDIPSQYALCAQASPSAEQAPNNDDNNFSSLFNQFVYDLFAVIVVVVVTLCLSVYGIQPTNPQTKVEKL
jgi:hypothetical protein